MQLAAAKTVIEKGLSVRRAEALAAQLLKDTQEKPAKKAAGVDYLGECARHLEQVLGRKVRMTQGRKTGRIELEYYDADDRCCRRSRPSAAETDTHRMRRQRHHD